MWAIDDWARLDRFLMLGTESNTFYQSSKALTKENAQTLMRCIGKDGPRAVNRIREISATGRAPKRDPAIFALALAASVVNAETRKLALYVMPEVCHIGTDLFHFAAYVEQFRGWGRGLRTAIGRWYTTKPPSDLAYQLIKYKERDGWSHRDLLRLSHPKPPTAQYDQLFNYATAGLPADWSYDTIVRQVIEAEFLKHDGVKTAAERIVKYDLPRECVPTELLNAPQVWEALLQNMPMTAMIRNLATMTRVGLFDMFSDNTKLVVSRLSDGEYLQRARVHPISILSALHTYAQGHGERGHNTWTPVSQITDALDEAFYGSFGLVEPSGKRIMVAIDTSGSMYYASPTVAGLPGLTSAQAAAAMAMITVASEPQCAVFGFSDGIPAKSITALDISKHRRLDDVLAYIHTVKGGGTDCSLPMMVAQQQKAHIDTFQIYTDNETWFGKIHPSQALRSYRETMGMPAKLAVVAFTATEFSIADPNDAGMMDFVGFDSSAPQLLADFAKAPARPFVEIARV